MINLKDLPVLPGVYLYRNSDSEIIYVGKAINLKKRISQYFQRSDALGPKTSALVSQISSVETKTVNSEIEALILEASLIKKYRPKFNSLLKDDRSYLYICISADAIPRVFSSHLSNIPPNSDIFGPFPNASAVKSILKTIRRIFPYRSYIKHPPRPCLYCHLGLCPGPDPDRKHYRRNIGKLRKLLSGNFKLLQRQLNKEMKTASKLENYELALILRRQIDSVNYIVSGWHSLNNLYETINLPEDNQSQAINELEITLKNYLKIRAINRIECFDISQTGTRHFVGAMTVYQNGHIDKTQYRKFKIKTKITPDDQYMLKEIVWRRLRHSDWLTPDLIVVDGGKPQVSAVSVITKIPLIGLAKRQETILLKVEDSWSEINLPQNSSALLLLEKLRNEAHRFANKYRQELVKRTMLL